MRLSKVVNYFIFLVSKYVETPEPDAVTRHFAYREPSTIKGKPI